MTLFETGYLFLRHLNPALYRVVRKELEASIRRGQSGFTLLDTGGRKSHYTIGLPLRVTVTDLPRSNEVQKSLHLGMTDELISTTMSRRTNLERYVFDDMTKSSLPDAAYDAVLAVEVIEHVPEDDRFVEQIARVLKPGGVFVATTPNGECIANTNPDHVRHYTRDQLHTLVSRHFPKVDTYYAVVNSAAHKAGLWSWSPRHPVRTLKTMWNNRVSQRESDSEAVRTSAKNTVHLVVRASK